MVHTYIRSLTLRSSDRSVSLKVARTSPRLAFSLVELLVVMAIIAILVALLLPVIRKVRYQASETACASNLRQIGFILSSYASENNGWYPKNGAIRNYPDSLKNGTAWDITIPLKKYVGFSNSAQKDRRAMDIFRCPLTTKDMVDTSTDSSYSLMFDTWGYITTPHGTIADFPSAANTNAADQEPGKIPTRPGQYGINGQKLWGAWNPTNSPQFSTGWTTTCPYLDERKLMRRLGQNWTGKISNGVEGTFDVVAMDYTVNGANINQTRVTNHPDYKASWAQVGRYWRGSTPALLPFTSANYLRADGSVTRHTFHNLDYATYWNTSNVIDNVYQMSSLGSIPKYFRLK